MWELEKDLIRVDSLDPHYLRSLFFSRFLNLKTYRKQDLPAPEIPPRWAALVGWCGLGSGHSVNIHWKGMVCYNLDVFADQFPYGLPFVELFLVAE
jgi:hypothetical protein